MLTILKTDDWRDIPPLKFYLEPLQKALDKVEKILLDMHSKGVLRIKYKIEENAELQNAVIEMVKKDNIAQWLAGDPLKRDQLKFIYDIHKIIGKSALKEYYLNGNNNKRIMESVIPQMTVFKAMLTIKEIDDKKLQD